MSDNINVSEIIGIIAASASVIVALVSIIGAMRAGVLTRLRLGNLLEIRATPQEREAANSITASAVRDNVPFETEQLALYYGQILTQSKISFWFSLVFASLGFAVIIVAVFLYTDGTTGATIAQFAAGVIMDAVAALFFVQSRNAQKSMGEFFDKLRRDRQHLESRKLCESIESTTARDALRIQLSLHYAEVLDAATVASSVIAAGMPPATPDDVAPT